MNRQICYDTEFHEDGRTIDLISIALVDQDGDEYYAVSSDFDVAAVLAHPWLSENVWPSLPTRVVPERNGTGGSRTELDLTNPDVKPRAQIAEEVAEFILRDGPDPELWAWYSAFDHVALCWLYGPMVPAVPAGIPHFTNCLRQSKAHLERHLGHRVNTPEQAVGHHNALHDARHNWVIKRHLARIIGSIGGCL